MKNENEKTTVAILATICRDVCIYGSINNRCGLDKSELDEHCRRCALAQIKEVTLKGPRKSKKPLIRSTRRRRRWAAQPCACFAHILSTTAW